MLDLFAFLIDSNLAGGFYVGLMQKQIVFFSGLLMSLGMASGFLLGAQDFVFDGEKGQSSQRHSEQKSDSVTFMEQDQPITAIDSLCGVGNQEQIDPTEGLLHDCDLETLLTLLSGKTSINGWACSGNEHLTEVIIPPGVTSIGDCAFGGCKNLRQITIPSSVASIGDAAFSGCLNLEKIIIQEDSQLEKIEARAFLNCSNLTEINIPNGVTLIEEGVFSGCKKLYQITIPSSATLIGKDAFFQCSNLHEIEIPKSVTSIAEGAFSECLNLISCSGGSFVRSIGERAFFKCRRLKSYSWSIRLGSIGKEAFAFCTALSAITIPESIVSIDERAFAGCRNLEIVELPERFKSIGAPEGRSQDEQFYKRPSLGQDLFEGCSKLKGMFDYLWKGYRDFTLEDWDRRKFMSKEMKYEDKSFWDNNRTLNVRDQNKIQDGVPFAIKIPDGVEQIADDSFFLPRACLKEVIIPSSVKTIGARAFFSCKDLVRIKLPFSVISIGESAFCNCSSLTQITIPNHVESMGNGAFFGCAGLTEIIIPNSVKKIGKNVFCNCSCLTKVTIPERYLVRFNDIFDQDLENWEQSQTNADGSIVLTKRQLEPKEETDI